jgi:hypothetical protein
VRHEVEVEQADAAACLHGACMRARASARDRRPVACLPACMVITPDASGEIVSLLAPPLLPAPVRAGFARWHRVEPCCNALRRTATPLWCVALRCIRFRGGGDGGSGSTGASTAFARRRRQASAGSGSTCGRAKVRMGQAGGLPLRIRADGCTWALNSLCVGGRQVLDLGVGPSQVGANDLLPVARCVTDTALRARCTPACRVRLYCGQCAFGAVWGLIEHTLASNVSSLAMSISATVSRMMSTANVPWAKSAMRERGQSKEPSLLGSFSGLYWCIAMERASGECRGLS